MDQDAAAPFEGGESTEYTENFQSIPKTTADTRNDPFVNPVWGTEADLSTTTFTPGVYLHNRDSAFEYLDPRDTSGLREWAKDIQTGLDQSIAATMSMAPVPGHFLSTASSAVHNTPAAWPVDSTGQPPTSSSLSASSSYAMVDDTTAALPPIMVGRPHLPTAQPASTAAGPGRPSRVSKPKSKPIGGGHRPPRANSGNSVSSPNSIQYATMAVEKKRSVSSSSSSSSPPLSDSLQHRNSFAGASIGGVGGLLTTGHGGNHNVTLRTASRKPKVHLDGHTGASSFSSLDAGAADRADMAKTVSPRSDESGPGSSPSSADCGSGKSDTLTSEELRQRKNHNDVEKEYRGRLNKQFGLLLSILPANQMEGADMDGNLEYQHRRMSKAEVLDLARRRIHALENEIQQLYTDRDSLRSNVAVLNLAIQNGQQRASPQQQQQKMGITI